MTPDSKPSQIVFFDGICGFCNTTVNTLIRLDKHKRLRFTPLQGQFALKNLDPQYREDLNTLVYLKNGKIYTRTDAVLHILRDLGGLGALLYPLLLIPSGLRNPIYNLFAKFRYTLFGKLDACRIPTPEERSRFLD